MTRPRRRPALVALGMALVAPLLALGAAAGQQAPTPGAPGIGDPYWPLDGNGGIDVASYRVHAAYDFDTGALRGRTGLRLTATADLSRFNLDFLLPVTGVTVDGRRARYDRRAGHELRITPERPLAAGTRHTVVVRYAGRPGRLAYAGERNWLADDREVVTMNEPHMAPWWFPANDHPLDKARFRIDITVPRGREAIANGRLTRTRTRGGRTTWSWRAAEPMAPYLAFFAAGDFTIERGRSHGLPWLNAVSEQLPPAQRRASLRLMRKTPGIVAALRRDLGAYPFSVTGGLTTALEPGFALENQTRPTYPAVGAHFTSLVVHELAHQWLGDDVSVARWRDIWLNEGAATFMEWRYAETHSGRTGEEILANYYDGFPAADGFWRLTIADPGPRHLFDLPVYHRGAMTLQALRNRIGEQAFWTLLRTWLAQRSGGNGTSEEFEALAEQVSGQDLDAFFTAWLRTPAKPAATAANGLAGRPAGRRVRR